MLNKNLFLENKIKKKKSEEASGPVFTSSKVVNFYYQILQRYRKI